MARVFTVGAVNQTVGGAITAVFINPPASPSVGVRLVRGHCQQSLNATSAQTRIQLVTQVTAFPTLTSATPRKAMFHDPNVAVITGGTAGAAGTAGTTASAEGAGAKTVIDEWVFNNLNGWDQLFTALDKYEFAAGVASGIGLFFVAAPSAGSGWSYSLTYEEM